ncbi:uncharacterized protein LOC109601928 isoform X4 [Aethina tumida]|uniref:uncharacterized protein LOC109601928 isoform X4 n=1 Tax=Aethina tumida TaxID=116153 RepID=UPI002147379A|nr:uncharacterized protein LOC109601928 isoform X4 [Aethina tumida]
MENIEYRSVIKFLFLKGNTPSQIKDELDSVYGDSAPSFVTVKFWAAEFKRGRKSLRDGERSERPKNATTDGDIPNVRNVGCSKRRNRSASFGKHEINDRTSGGHTECSKGDIPDARNVRCSKGRNRSATFGKHEINDRTSGGHTECSKGVIPDVRNVKCLKGRNRLASFGKHEINDRTSGGHTDCSKDDIPDARNVRFSKGRNRSATFGKHEINNRTSGGYTECSKGDIPDAQNVGSSKGTAVLSDGSKIKHPVEDEHSYASSSCSGCFNCLTSEVEIKKEPNEEASNSEIKEIKMELNEPILHSENDIKVESVEHCQISPNYLCQRLESKVDIKTEPKEEHNDLQSYCNDHSNLLHSEIDIKMDPNEGYS